MTVSDADREAAIALIGLRAEDYPDEFARFQDGSRDKTPYVKAFAAHREAAERDALERAAKLMDERHKSSDPTMSGGAAIRALKP